MYFVDFSYEISRKFLLPIAVPIFSADSSARIVHWVHPPAPIRSFMHKVKFAEHGAAELFCPVS